MDIRLTAAGYTRDLAKLTGADLAVAGAQWVAVNTCVPIGMA